jgi:taurine dioxygenase
VAISVHPISTALGAEIRGVDLSKPLAPAVLTEVRQIWLQHLVIFFRDQTLTPEQYVAATKQFGEANEYPFIEGMKEAPEITQVIKKENEKVNFGGLWHTDTTYLECPPMATMLMAREVPPVGGDTLFANMYTAYDTLSDGLKKMLQGLWAVHHSAKESGARTREEMLKEQARKDTKPAYIAEHPVVRTHPETGRKALYCDGAHVIRFKDMTEEESAPLLEYLFRHATQPEFTCRFRWTAGTVALWDNRCAQHFALNDYHGHRRVMHRVTLKGDKPR